MNCSPMKAAIEEAKQGVALSHGGPFGAVVVLNDQIIGRGHNKVITCKDPTAHAEIEAIRNACSSLKTNNLSGAVLYTTCYPCPMCLGAILWAKIDKVYYCISSEDVAEIGFADDKFYNNIKDKAYLEKIFIMDDTERAACIELLECYSQSDHELY